jgi:hypothetical protein
MWSEILNVLWSSKCIRLATSHHASLLNKGLGYNIDHYQALQVAKGLSS